MTFHEFELAASAFVMGAFALGLYNDTQNTRSAERERESRARLEEAHSHARQEAYRKGWDDALRIGAQETPSPGSGEAALRPVMRKSADDTDP